MRILKKSRIFDIKQVEKFIKMQRKENFRVIISISSEPHQCSAGVAVKATSNVPHL